MDSLARRRSFAQQLYCLMSPEQREALQQAFTSFAESIQPLIVELDKIGRRAELRHYIILRCAGQRRRQMRRK